MGGRKPNRNSSRRRRKPDRFSPALLLKFLLRPIMPAIRSLPSISCLRPDKCKKWKWKWKKSRKIWSLCRLSSMPLTCLTTRKCQAVFLWPSARTPFFFFGWVNNGVSNCQLTKATKWFAFERGAKMKSRHLSFLWVFLFHSCPGRRHFPDGVVAVAGTPMVKIQFAIAQARNASRTEKICIMFDI